MRRGPAVVAVVLAGLVVLGACGDGAEDASPATTTSTTAPSTTSAEGGGVHFDPGLDGEPVDEVDDDPCTPDPGEGNEAATIGDRIDCDLPQLAPLVGGTTMLGQDGRLEVTVSGELDVAQALQVCEVAIGVIATELAGWPEVRLVITADPSVVFGQAPTPIVTASGVGTCTAA